MKTADSPADAPQAAAVQNYEFVCIAAALVLVLTLLQRSYTVWCVLPLLVGLLGVYARMSLAPVMLILTLVPQLIEQWSARAVWSEEFDVGALLQCVAVLGYMAGQYRLQGLTLTLLPADPRRRKGDPKQPGQGPARRAVPAREISSLLIGTLAGAGAAQFVWAWLPDDWYELGLLPRAWRMLALGWALGLGVLVGAAFVSYVVRGDMTRAEATQFLQDVLWRETRGEQRRASRWLAWARLRYQQRLERLDR